MIDTTSVRTVARHDPETETEDIRQVAAYLVGRGLAADDPKAADVFRQLLELPSKWPERRVSVSRAATYFYVSRRWLGRCSQRAGLPTPSHVLTFGRVLRTVQLARRHGMTFRRAAAATGWPDPFSMSNTMHRLTGLRPSDTRRHGLIYVAEAWLQRELDAGRVELRSPGPPRCPSCGQVVNVASTQAKGGQHERQAS